MNIQSIFKRLNFMEQNALNKYLNSEISKACMKMAQNLHEEAAAKEAEIEALITKRENDIIQMNDYTWNKIFSWTEIAMRENKISKDRCDRIGRRIQDIADSNKSEKQEEKLLITRLYSDYVVLTKEEVFMLVEWALDGKCKACSGKSNCEVRELYKKIDIPELSDNELCGYRYVKDNKGRIK